MGRVGGQRLAHQSFLVTAMVKKRKPPDWIKLNNADWCVLVASGCMATYLLGWGTLRLMGWLPPPDPPEPFPIMDTRPYAVMFGMASVYFGWLTIRLFMFAVFYHLEEWEKDV
jgi:hypothetical protein